MFRVLYFIASLALACQAASADISNGLVNATVSRARVALNKAATAVPSAVETLVNSAVNEDLAKTAGEVKARLGPGFGAWKGKNVVVFITDQESPLLNVPPGWEEANLPGITRLKKNGLEFRRAYSNAAMCTSARATLFTGFLTTQTNARYVLEDFLPGNLNPQINTPSDLPNLATAAEAAGYEVVYKGKMHLTKAANSDGTWSAADSLKYGFKRWNFPDAGANQLLSESGGLPTENDKRFMEGTGPVDEGKEGVYQYLKTRAASGKPKPFFLIISLINPHDVLFYPNQFAASGYSPSLLVGDVTLPLTYNESLATKPRAQMEWANLNRALGIAPRNESQAVAYLNFYANLIKQSDAFLNTTLNLLDQLGMTQNTVVIRTADHGEMAMSHDGQIQKMFNMYEESVRVPLVISNPVLYPKKQSSTALVSHVDFVPTLATLLGAPATLSVAAGWQGVSYAGVVVDPQNAPPPQDTVVFTFDDFQYGQNPYIGAPFQPNHLRSIIEERWKYAEYFDPTGRAPSQYEMYDLLTDPLEVHNLAFHDPNVPQEVNTCASCAQLTPFQQQQKNRLHAKLQATVATTLRPRLGVKWPLNLTATTTLVQLTELDRSDSGATTGFPVGGANAQFPVGGAFGILQSAVTVNPTAPIEIVYTPLNGTSFVPARNGAGFTSGGAGGPCFASVQWSVLSNAGSIFGTAKAACFPTANGGMSFSGTASVYAGTSSFRGLRAEGLKFAAFSPPPGQNGTASITGIAETKSLAAA